MAPPTGLEVAQQASSDHKAENMEKLEAYIQGKLKLLKFTLGKTDEVLESNTALAINRHRDALNTLVGSIDQLKLQVLEEMFKNSETDEVIATWTAGIETQVAEVDTKVTYRNQQLTRIKAEEDHKAKESEKILKTKEREEQLEFERAQLKQKLEFELKIEECKKNRATKASEVKTSVAQHMKFPKLTITKFNGSHTDWLRFWNIFEAEIDKCSDLAGVTKFVNLKDLLEPKVRAGIDGKTSEIVNAYVRNITALPIISGTNPVKIHQFYEKLLFNVQALETLGKLKEVNGYVRTSLDKLEGIRGDLVRTDDDWREWDFTKFVDALRKWTERNPLPVKSTDKNQDTHPSRRTSRDPVYNTQQGDIRLRACVYCDSADHRKHECNKITEPSQRRKILIPKRLCFNCTGADHKVTECKSRRTCFNCKRRHHTSICDSQTMENSMMAAQNGDGPVVYPVVVVEVAGVKRRALLDSGAGSSYTSAALLKKIGAKLHHSGMRKIEMMLGSVNGTMEVYRIKLQSMNGDFEMEADVTKVEKPATYDVGEPSLQEAQRETSASEGRDY